MAMIRLRCFSRGLLPVEVAALKQTSKTVRRTREKLPLRTRATERRWLEMYEGKNAGNKAAISRPRDTDRSLQRWP